MADAEGGFSSRLHTLGVVLEQMGDVAIAVSGGVDSMTLAAFAHEADNVQVTMFHALSPAVPVEASDRVRRFARELGWNLVVIDAGELRDARYTDNPTNRCFFCKENLYRSIAEKTGAVICSGTNVDDLGDYRPGLQAAASHAVRHPLVEAGFSKADIRILAHILEMDDVADLPASPCLASRVETGIPIRPEVLLAIDAVERAARSVAGIPVVRCRVRKEGVVLETGRDLPEAPRRAIVAAAQPHLVAAGLSGSLSFAAYKQGSAFLRVLP